MHVIANALEDLSSDLDLLAQDEAQMEPPIARADGVRRAARHTARDGTERHDTGEAPRLATISRDFH